MSYKLKVLWRTQRKCIFPYDYLSKRKYYCVAYLDQNVCQDEFTGEGWSYSDFKADHFFDGLTL